MLRITSYAMLIVILATEAASAQTNTQDAPRYSPMPGYSPMRTQEERRNDSDIDRAYKSTVKTLSNTEKKKTDPWSDVRPEPPAAAKNKQQ